MNNIPYLIPCNVWSFLIILGLLYLGIYLVDRWETKDRYNKLMEKSEEANRESQRLNP